MGKVTATDIMKLLEDGKSPPCMEDLEDGILSETDKELTSLVADFFICCDELSLIRKRISILADKEGKK